MHYCLAAGIELEVDRENKACPWSTFCFCFPGFGPQQQQQSHSQYPMSGPQGPEHGPRTGFSQQQLMQQQQLQAMQQRQQRQQAYLREQQRQQAYLQEQQRQQAYLQEQQRLAKEEQRKREFEIQKRKLAQLGVSKTSKPAANPLDDLFGKKPPSVSTSSSSLASHRAGKCPHMD